MAFRGNLRVGCGACQDGGAVACAMTKVYLSLPLNWVARQWCKLRFARLKRDGQYRGQYQGPLVWRCGNDAKGAQAKLRVHALNLACDRAAR